jgi:DNA-binding IscR family transcriptional regulator
LIDIIDAVRTRQTGRLTVDQRGVSPASQVMDEAQAAVRERLAGRTLKDWVANSRNAS